MIDLEKRKLVDECTVKARALITEHRDKIEELSNTLLAKETIDFKVIYGILGERPFKLKPTF